MRSDRDRPGHVPMGCALACVLLVAGCGGGSSSSSTSSVASGASGAAPLAADALVSQANSACAAANTKVEALTAPSGSPSLSELANLTAQALPIATQLYDQLATLTPPSDLAAKYGAYLSNLKTQLGVASDLESAERSGDSASAQSAGRKLSSVSTQGNSQASALGLTECAKSPQPKG